MNMTDNAIDRDLAAMDAQEDAQEALREKAGEAIDLMLKTADKRFLAVLSKVLSDSPLARYALAEEIRIDYALALVHDAMLEAVYEQQEEL